ncbi:MAG: amidohydrolase family protein [Planctomycetes bacterium]|nr:amidohydrolase family protein [Planctomycetota bacterium]
MRGLLRAIAVAAAAAVSAGAPEAPETDGARIAIRCGTILPVEGEPLRDAVILIRDGKIEALGRDVAIPDGVETIDASRCVVVPGFVAPMARIGLGSGPTGADKKAGDALDPFTYDWSRLARHGFTTVNLVPDGEGILGRGTAIRPVPLAERAFEARKKELVRRDATALRIVFRASTAAKQGLRKAIEDARRGIEEEKKAKEAAEKKAKEAAEKKEAPDAKKEEPAKKEEKPKEPSPAELVMRDVVRGRIPVVVEFPQASDIAHFSIATRGLDLPPFWIAIDADASPAADRLEEMERPIIAPPVIANVPGTMIADPFVRDLAWKGIEIALRPAGSREGDFAEYAARVGQLIRAGLSRRMALHAATLAPARAIGLDAEIGSLVAGKRADILILDGEPFDLGTRVVRVIVEGRTVFRIEDVLPADRGGAP